MPSMHPPGDGHARRARGDEHELVATGPRDRVHEPDALREHARHLAQHVVAGARPGRRVQLAEARRRRTARRTPRCPAAAPARPPAPGRGRRCARSRGPSADRSGRPARATRRARRHGRGPEGRDRGGGEVGDRRPAASPPRCRRACSPAQPNVSTPTHASTVAAAGDDERQVRAGHRGAVRSSGRRGRASRCGRGRRGGRGDPGCVTTSASNAATASSAIPSVSSSSRVSCGPGPARRRRPSPPRRRPRRPRRSPRAPCPGRWPARGPPRPPRAR